MRGNWNDDPFDANSGDDPGQGAHVDVHERDDELTVIADIPGARKEDIDLKCDGRVLSIHAPAGPHSYDEHVDLPDPVDEHSANATFNNGVLEVTLERADGAPNVGFQ